jgi:hypothetical protein
MLIFYKSGEFIDLSEVIEMQLNNEPIVLGKILPFFGGSYSKLDILHKKNPDIFTLGNSRVLQFRSNFFKDKNLFFNGGGIQSDKTGVEHFKDVLETSSGYSPKIIIIGLEQAYFNNNIVNINDVLSDESGNFSLLQLLDAWRKIFFNIFKSEYSYAKVFQNEKCGIKKIGSMATLKNAGVRSDGSYFYGYLIDNPNNDKLEDYKFRETFRRIEKGEGLFSYGNDISEKSVAELGDFLEYCSKNEIHVIAFFPPYAKEVLEKIEESGKYGYIFKLHSTLNPLFNKYNFSLFDYTDMDVFEGRREEVIDGFHASEKAYLRLFIDMAENDEILNSYTDVDYLKKRLDEEESDLEVFRFE